MPQYPFRNPDLPLETRLDDLLSRLTLQEKISQMVFDAPAVPHLGIPAYNWWNECLHGVGRAGLATVFPQSIGLGATWNPDLVKRIATAISDEARAKYHAALSQGRHDWYWGLTFWSPNINIFRDPRWGRGQETYGEDPYLTGRLGVSFVSGLQGDDPQYLKVAATPKHYAVHSGPEHARHHFDARATDEDMRRTYLPAFDACVREAKAESIMGAYNRTNGEPCCASPTLLGEILRGEWDFQGYVVSDCGAIQDIFSGHKVASDPAEAAAMAVRAGCDLECGSVYPALNEAVERGLITEAEIDQSVRRLFRSRFRLGMFDPQERVPYAKIPLEVVDSPQHRELALEAARQSIVLLKNEDGLLPLKPEITRIAVIGPNANDPAVMLGNYNGVPSRIVTPFHGILARGGGGVMVDYTPGCGLLEKDPSAFARALEMAEASQVIIFVAGLSQRLEGEEGQEEGVSVGNRSEGDRQDLALPPVQEELLQALHATGKPVVLVLLNGSPISLAWASQNIPAILEAWYPGQDGGTAIAEVLFGDYNPAGRLPITFYRSVIDLPPFEDYSMLGRTYRYFAGEVSYPFGWGLSYTQFSYANLLLLKGKEGLSISVDVKNTGDFPGEEVAQLYLHSTVGDNHEPIHELRGFKRLFIPNGETTTVNFNLDTSHLYPGLESWQVAVGGHQPTKADWDGGGDMAVGTVAWIGKS